MIDGTSEVRTEAEPAQKFGTFLGVFTPSVLTILGLGLLNLYSATRVAPAGLYTQQLMWLSVGLVLFVLAASIDYRIYERMAPWLYGVLLAALVAVLVVGHTSKGSSRWLSLGAETIRIVQMVQDPQGIERRDESVVVGVVEVRDVGG